MSDLKSTNLSPGMRRSGATHHEAPLSVLSVDGPTEKSFGISFSTVFALIAAWFIYDLGPGFVLIMLATVSLSFLGLAYMAQPFCGRSISCGSGSGLC